MNKAVLKTGGKQYLVTEGEVIKVEKLLEEAGKKVKFSEVLLTSDDKNTVVGTPFVKGATVEGEVVTHARHNKIFGVKMKAKKRNKKLFGHKQHYTEVKITSIKAGK